MVGQMSLQIDRLAVLAGAERILGDVDLHRAGQRIGHHQRRRGEVVGAGRGLTRPSKLRLPESTEADHQVAVADRLGDGIGQRAGIADAGGAAIAHQVEAELSSSFCRPAASR